MNGASSLQTPAIGMTLQQSSNLPQHQKDAVILSSAHEL
jgi:hypothetical protein